MKGWQEYMIFYGDNSIDIDAYADAGCYISSDDFPGYEGVDLDDGDLKSGINEIQRLLRKIAQPATLWRSKATPDKNLAECEGCKNKAVQCICDDEWCLDSKQECKAFKRHSECCMKNFAENLWRARSNEKKIRQLHQSYNAKRENAQVSFCARLFLT